MAKIIRASLFVLLLSVCANADDGIMQTGKTSSTQPPASSTQTSEEPVEAADGIMQTGVAEAVTEVSLDLLQSLLTLF